MFKPISIYIGLRYTRAKRRNRFISFISLASILGIALGVMVLITVLSVMNGFDYQIRTRFFAIAPEVTVLTSADISQSWPRYLQEIDALSVRKLTQCGTHLPNKTEHPRPIAHAKLNPRSNQLPVEK